MDKSSMPLSAAMEDYLRTCSIEGKTPKTLRDYREKLARFVDWHGGTLGEFTLASAREFVADLQQTHKWSTHRDVATSEKLLSPQTVANYVRVIKGFATWLFEEEYVPTNVLARLSKPKVPKKIIPALEPDEVGRLLRAVDPSTAKGARDAALLSIFLDCGLRLSEVTNLRMGDVHIDSGWIRVWGKGDKERVVPMGRDTTRTLGRYMQMVRSGCSTDDWLFVGFYGNQLRPEGLRMLVRRLKEQAGLKRLHPHLLRHTFATYYLISGGDPFTLQDVLGHATLDMTKTYVDVARKFVAVQHERFSPMDRVFRPARKGGFRPPTPATAPPDPSLAPMRRSRQPTA